MKLPVIAPDTTPLFWNIDPQLLLWAGGMTKENRESLAGILEAMFEAQ